MKWINFSKTRYNSKNFLGKITTLKKSFAGYCPSTLNSRLKHWSLRERNLGAPRTIRLLKKILTWLILQLSKEAITTYK